MRQGWYELNRTEGRSSRAYGTIRLHKKRTAGVGLPGSLMQGRDDAERLRTLLTNVLGIVEEKAGPTEPGDLCCGWVLLAKDRVVPHLDRIVIIDQESDSPVELN